MLFGCLIEKSYHKIGFCEAKGFIHFAFCILHFAFSSSPINCNFSFLYIIPKNFFPIPPEIFQNNTLHFDTFVL